MERKGAVLLLFLLLLLFFFASQAPLRAAAVQRRRPGAQDKLRVSISAIAPRLRCRAKRAKSRGQTSRVGTRGEPAPAPCAWHHGGRLPGSDDSVR